MRILKKRTAQQGLHFPPWPKRQNSLTLTSKTESISCENSKDGGELVLACDRSRLNPLVDYLRQELLRKQELHSTQSKILFSPSKTKESGMKWEVEDQIQTPLVLRSHRILSPKLNDKQQCN